MVYGAELMPLEVHTAILDNYRNPDGLNITQSGGAGFTFAPSIGLARKHKPDGTDREWLNFVQGYTEEMRESYRLEKQVWVNLLALPRVVLLCRCAEAARCHRTVLASQILPKLGAVYRGEIS